jgi:hypothetical protein
VKRVSCFLVLLCCQNFVGLCFTCETWDSKLVKRVETLPCQASLETIMFWFLMCDPFSTQGLRGKKSTPNVH